MGDSKKKPLMTVEVSQEGNRITTSIKINPEILREAKHLAIDRGTTFSQILEEALKQELEKKRKAQT